MKVYVLLERDYDFTTVYGVFSSKDLANDAEYELDHSIFMDIETFELDKLDDAFRPIHGPPVPPPPPPPRRPTLEEAISTEYAKIGVLWVPQESGNGGG